MTAFLNCFFFLRVSTAAMLETCGDSWSPHATLPYAVKKSGRHCTVLHSHSGRHLQCTALSQRAPLHCTALSQRAPFAVYCTLTASTRRSRPPRGRHWQVAARCSSRTPRTPRRRSLRHRPPGPCHSCPPRNRHRNRHPAAGDSAG